LRPANTPGSTVPRLRLARSESLNLSLRFFSLDVLGDACGNHMVGLGVLDNENPVINFRR